MHRKGEPCGSLFRVQIMKPDFYLFDLDGTLADTAPDLAAAANHLCEVRGLPLPPYERLRSVASSGARGLLGASIGVAPGESGYDELVKEFLDWYEDHLTDHLKFFAGASELLSGIEAQGKKWGIVTNKRESFTSKIIAALGMHPDAVVCGDTIPQRKPLPEPVLYAVNSLGYQPCQGVYVGDDIRDIKSGSAAGCKTIAAGWGYFGHVKPIDEWGADLVAKNPLEILEFSF